MRRMPNRARLCERAMLHRERARDGHHGGLLLPPPCWLLPRAHQRGRPCDDRCGVQRPLPHAAWLRRRLHSQELMVGRLAARAVLEARARLALDRLLHADHLCRGRGAHLSQLALAEVVGALRRPRGVPQQADEHHRRARLEAAQPRLHRLLALSPRPLPRGRALLPQIAPALGRRPLHHLLPPRRRATRKRQSLRSQVGQASLHSARSARGPRARVCANRRGAQAESP
mmetsp:Transcript_4606/g.10107  ORF Transcript_4606/g.10107 Transcript_4606/m.10107 type:complete len:229 (+) Transcript_4606:784-1470(+)